MKSNKELHKIWKEYINIPLYRVVPIRDLKNIREKGINPKKDPYENVKPKIKEFAKVITGLEDKGIIIKVNWGRPVHGSYAIGVSLNDLNLMAVDFAPTREDVEYYLKLRGGALVSNINKLTDEVMKNNINLTDKEIRLVNELNKWAKSKVCNNVDLAH